jgi:hypothetical protein
MWVPLNGFGVNAVDLGTFTITGGGSATYTSKNTTMFRLGPLVIYNFRFAVNAAGSGSTNISITNLPKIPTSIGNYMWSGDRGGTGVVRLLARGATNGDVTTFYTVSPSGAIGGPITGADLANGASYSLWATFLSIGAY